MEIVTAMHDAARSVERTAKEIRIARTFESEATFDQYDSRRERALEVLENAARFLRDGAHEAGRSLLTLAANEPVAVLTKLP